VSIGTITNGFDDIAPGERELDPSLSPNVLNILKKALNHPNGFYSTLDVFFASSGTGVVNSSNGKLVGIINAIENLSDRIADHYVSGISTGVTARHIREVARKKLTPEEYQKTFSCGVF
jgi:hypothetical protein